MTFEKACCELEKLMENGKFNSKFAKHREMLGFVILEQERDINRSKKILDFFWGYNHKNVKEQ